MDKNINPETFDNLGISREVLEVLTRAGFVKPTPIQHKSIPIAIEGKDILGIAQTGTGKTLAFGIPLLERLLKVRGRALVLVPTRELALQVEETLAKIGNILKIRSAVLIGGEPIYRQKRALQSNPRVLVATPGRLIDHLKQGHTNLADIHTVVLDEADHMLDIGFAPQINEIMKRVPKERQTMLFSATMPSAIVELATKYMALPLRIEVAPSGTAAEKVEQEMIVVDKQSKFPLLVKVLGEHSGSVLVFARMKYSAKKIAEALRGAGITAAEIHSNRSLGQRREALSGFKAGKYRVLVATDIAARGIDVKGIALVVNYDLPEKTEDYVHRIGRTGRAGEVGRAISFASPDQHRDIMDIERLIRKTLEVKSHAGARIIPGSRSVHRQRGQSRGGRPGGWRGGRPGGFSGGPRDRSHDRPQRRSFHSR